MDEDSDGDMVLELTALLSNSFVFSHQEACVLDEDSDGDMVPEPVVVTVVVLLRSPRGLCFG